MKLRNIINEISTKAGLEDVIKGRTSSIEGIKMSKELAQGMMDFIMRSPYGRKYSKQILRGRIASLIGPANAFGIERYLSPKAKKEFKAVYKKHGPKRESVDERLNLATAKRMDGLHNMKAMKQVIIGAKTIQKDLYDEGFENDEILEFLMDRIRRAAF